MLLRFRVANYRSLKGEQELSLVATEFNEGTARSTGVRAEGREIRVLPVVGIYGANASGKSNVLRALQAMCEAVRSSLAEWAQEQGVPREPFALDAGARDETTLFEVDLLLGEQPVRYTYGFELSDDRVEAEWLHAYPHRHRQVWFDRDASRSGADEFSFPGEGMKGGKRDKEQLVEFTRPNSLFLTTAASLNHPQLTVLYRFFADLQWRSAQSGLVTERIVHTESLLTRSRRKQHYRDLVGDLLRKADLGVTGIRVVPRAAGQSRVRLLHQSGGDEPVPLDLASQESNGTVEWFGHLGPALESLERGSALAIDELNASLHPTLSAELIRLFRDPRSNPHDAQLIFTAHDATLLGSAMVERPLDRDEVWITSKRRTGETELYPLVDAKPRKEENLERGYLRGRYGGAPRITTGDLVRELSRPMEDQ